jgi:hypothetical protein
MKKKSIAKKPLPLSYIVRLNFYRDDIRKKKLSQNERTVRYYERKKWGGVKETRIREKNRTRIHYRKVFKTEAGADKFLEEMYTSKALRTFKKKLSFSASVQLVRGKIHHGKKATWYEKGTQVTEPARGEAVNKKTEKNERINAGTDLHNKIKKYLKEALLHETPTGKKARKKKKSLRPERRPELKVIMVKGHPKIVRGKVLPIKTIKKPVKVKFYTKSGKAVSFKDIKTIKKPVKVKFYVGKRKKFK